MDRACVVMLALGLSACSGGQAAMGSAAAADDTECAPFARQLTGLRLYGDAASWWDQADGRYQRQSSPIEGGVLVFRRSARLPSGHVSVVAGQASPREIRVTQANWVHHRITRDEPVVDVSAANDWSEVRVWWAPTRSLGTTVYPTYGFIGRPPMDARTAPLAMAGSP